MQNKNYYTIQNYSDPFFKSSLEKKTKKKKISDYKGKKIEVKFFF